MFKGVCIGLIVRRAVAQICPWFVPTAENVIGGVNRYCRNLRKKVSFVLFIDGK